MYIDFVENKYPLNTAINIFFADFQLLIQALIPTK